MARLKVASAMIIVALAGWGSAMSLAWGQAPSGKYTINVAAMILAEPGVETPLPIQIASSDSVPKNSFIRIRGMPPSATLSEGHVISPGSWAVPLSALPTLRLAAPISAASKSQLTVALVGVDGTVWAETKAALAVIPASSLPVIEQGPAQQTTIATVGPAGAPPPQAGTSVPAIQPVLPRSGASAVPLPQVPARPEDERALKLVTKGRELIEEGDIAGARLFFQRAVDLGLARAAVALAETYDPNELNRLGVRGMQPDIAAARHWYERALQLGAPEADERLRRLSSR